jgi:AbiU2
MSRSMRFKQSLEKLPAPDRVYLARERLGQTVRLVHELICLTEQRRAFLITTLRFDIDWQQNRSFETLFVTIVYLEIMHLCRLWDPPESEGYSIPALALIVGHPDVLRAIESALLQDRDPSIAVVDLQNLQRALGDVPVVESGDTLRRLRNHRHKHAAHAVLRSEHEAGGKLIGQPDLLRDAENIIGQTLKMMGVACSLVSPHYEDFEKIRLRERETAERFFAVVGPALAEAAKGT